MKTYTVIAGVNGVGKSSFTGAVKHFMPELGTIIDPDRIAREEGCSAIEGHKVAVQKLRQCTLSGESFTQETTLSGHAVKRRIREAANCGYRIQLIYIGLDSCEESLLRIQNRVRKGGHNIDAETVVRRYQRRWDDLTEILPLCHKAEFYDNSNGFHLISLYENNKMNVLSPAPPHWLKEFIEHS